MPDEDFSHDAIKTELIKTEMAGNEFSHDAIKTEETDEDQQEVDEIGKTFCFCCKKLYNVPTM